MRPQRAMMMAVIGLGVSLATAGVAGPSATERLKLMAPDPKWNAFSGSVAVDGDTAIVGAFGDNSSGLVSGSAFLFDATTGGPLQTFTAFDAEDEAKFGWSVAIDGGIAIVGAPYDDGGRYDSGSAYLIDLTTSGQTKLRAPDPGTSDLFGLSVGISGNTAIVGAVYKDEVGTDSGAAYLFDARTGDLVRRLFPQDHAAYDNFGASVAISGSIAIVGASMKDEETVDAGSAYLFDVTTGQQLHKLTPSDPDTSDLFGYSVGIDGDIAIVGAWWDDDNGTDSGSAYLFDVQTGSQIAKLTSPDGAAGDLFGCSVAVSGTNAIVGARRQDVVGHDSGAAYWFDATTGDLIDEPVPGDPAAEDEFGVSVAISGDTAVFGAWGHDEGVYNAGAAYVFDVPEPTTASLTILGSLALVFRRRNGRPTPWRKNERPSACQ